MQIAGYLGREPYASVLGKRDPHKGFNIGVLLKGIV